MIKEKVIKVMDTFVKQELGNKVTVFNTQGLLFVLLDAVDRAEKEAESKKEAKPKKAEKKAEAA